MHLNKYYIKVLLIIIQTCLDIFAIEWDNYSLCNLTVFVPLKLYTCIFVFSNFKV